MNTRNIKKYIHSVIFRKKNKRKAPKREIISIRESDRSYFKKRKRKVIAGFFRRFSIPFGKISIIYYSATLWIIAVVSIIIIFLWPLFNVKDIYITRGNSNVNIDLAYEAIDSLRGRKIFSIESATIEDLILQRQKNVENISVDIQLPSTINIAITSYDSIFQTYIWGKLYNIVENGTIIPTTNIWEFSYLHIYNQSQSLSTIPDYKQILDGLYLNSIMSVRNSLIENIVQLQVQDLHYYVAERELIIVLESGIELIFDLTKNLWEQIEKLVVFHNESGDITKKNLIYIDLRITNKIFFCDTSTEFLCRTHLRDIYGTKKPSPSYPEEES